MNAQNAEFIMDNPCIIVDASFVLGNTLHEKHFEKDTFVSNCKIVRGLKRKGARLLDAMHSELRLLLQEYAQDSDIRACLDDLSEVREWTKVGLREDYFLDIFRKNIKDIGASVSDLSGRPDLSRNDIQYCAYALLKSKESDIIAATRDKCIMDSLSYAFASIHAIRKDISWPDTAIAFARTYDELEKQRSLMHSTRKLSNMHARFLASPYSWNHYRKKGGEVWQSKNTCNGD